MAGTMEEQRPAPVSLCRSRNSAGMEKTSENTRLSRFAEAHQGGNMHPNMYDLNSADIITFHALINNQIIEVSGHFLKRNLKNNPDGEGNPDFLTAILLYTVFFCRSIKR